MQRKCSTPAARSVFPKVDAGAHLPPAAADAAADGCIMREQPDCSQQPCTWALAQHKLPACVMQPLTPFYQQRCGEYDTLVGQGADSLAHYFYDKRGKLVGTADTGLSPGPCVAFDPSFEVPDYKSCKLITPKCPAPAEDDAGS